MKDERELEHRALVIKELTSSQGWKYLMELCDKILQNEKDSLVGQKLDGGYYEKIGFIQGFNYTSNILPGLVENKKVMEYIMHQGRAKGISAFCRSPILFWDSLTKNTNGLKDFFNKGKTEDNNSEKEKFLNENLK